jgi:hypothetical protein
MHGAPGVDHGLATVIPLSPRPPEVDRAVAILERRVGPGWPVLPSVAGRSALRAEDELGNTPAAIDPSVTPACAALATARRVAACARFTLELLTDEVIALSEALHADLEGLDLEEIDALAAAVVELSTAPPPAPAWGRPAAAEGAAVVLELVSPVLHDAAEAHERLYERFTDHVWDIPAPLLSAATSRWRGVARLRLHLHLRRTSRSGSRPGRITALAEEIIQARAIRARVAPLRPLLAHHLGVLDRGVFTDVEAAAEALAAVRRLQASLAGVLDEDRLERLLLADAFRSHELLSPAQSIRTTLAAWVADNRGAGGSGPLELTAGALARWVDAVEPLLGLVEDGTHALEQLGVATPTLREVVDALVLREHVAEQAGAPDGREAIGQDEGHDEPVEHLGAAERWSVS